MRALIAPKFRASRSARATERRKLLTSASKASTPSKPRIYASFATFEDWNDPAMDIYDDYDQNLSTKTCKRADVVLVLFPNSDLRTAKLRPALVVQANDLNTGLQQVLVAMISSKLMRANHPSRIFVSRATSGRDTGLLVDSVVMTDN